MQEKVIDHLFRHQYGRMVSILTRIFGLTNLELIEDAVQDTFMQATLKWRKQLPDNPEAWLIQASKNRVVDLFRKIKADSTRENNYMPGPATLKLNDLFLDHEIEDSQLRMIFIACHPFLDERDQIAFALKTIAGFSAKEIASALLIKEETIKKRLSRARSVIKEKNIKFNFPNKTEIPERIKRIHQVLYLIFNEGFQSNRKEMLIRKDLCGEALRLCKMLLSKKKLRTGGSYALFSLFCFHSSRLESKMDEDGKFLDLKSQDRSKWFKPLIDLGNDALKKAYTFPDFSSYHLEAGIAGQHVNAKSFSDTNWTNILIYYKRLYEVQQDSFSALNLAIVHLQVNEFEEAIRLLDNLDETALQQRVYLYHATRAEYHVLMNQIQLAKQSLELALLHVNNESEKEHLLEKIASL